MKPSTDTKTVLSSNLTTHIMPTASNLLGVCIMSLSLIKLLPRHGWSSLIDEALALDSVVFLISVALSYASLRISRHATRLENWAEMLFLFGLSIIILASLVLAYGIN